MSVRLRVSAKKDVGENMRWVPAKKRVSAKRWVSAYECQPRKSVSQKMSVSQIKGLSQVVSAKKRVSTKIWVSVYECQPDKDQRASTRGPKLELATAPALPPKVQDFYQWVPQSNACLCWLRLRTPPMPTMSQCYAFSCWLCRRAGTRTSARQWKASEDLCLLWQHHHRQ